MVSVVKAISNLLTDFNINVQVSKHFNRILSIFSALSSVCIVQLGKVFVDLIWRGMGMWHQRVLHCLQPL